MNILIDTNIVISLEPTSPDYREPRTAVAAELVRVATEGGNRLLLHPDSLRELAGFKNNETRELRDVLLGKYVRLDPAPAMAERVRVELGDVHPPNHDYVDHLMLSAVVANAVQFLVTDDGRIIKKASRLGIADRVFTVEDALALLTSLLGRTPQPPPLVEATKAYDLDSTDPIFDSFRKDYNTFDTWLVTSQREQRKTWVIRDGGNLAAVCIIKEHDDELQLGGPTLKVCSLKVSESRAGRRYGELLLKTIFRFLDENGYEYVFLTVFEHHAELIALLEDFGFVRHEPDKASGERYYVKPLLPTAEQRAAMPGLDFHVRFGPPALRLIEDDVFLVPIQPQYHRLLFPDAGPQDTPQQLEFDAAVIPPRELRPFGNALRKAYLCNTSNRRLRPGSTLLFYRSWDEQAVTCVGVVEDTLVSSDATAVAEFVGQRTVYSFQEIEAMCRGGEVVAIRFRQDRLLPEPIGHYEMVSAGMASRAPQSVQRVPSEAIPWLTGRIGG
jgi:ribosomal protein S18 acetylase RimI-like enzyme